MTDKKPLTDFMTNIQTLIGNLKTPKVVGGGTCEGCKQHYSLQEFYAINNGEAFLGKVGCICANKLLEKEMSDFYYKGQKEKHLKQFEALSRYPKSLHNASMKSYHPKTQMQLEVKQKLIKYTKDFDLEKGVNVVLAGEVGVGKSHLAVACCKTIVDRNFSSIFISVPRLLSELRTTYGTEKQLSELEYLKKLEEVDLLVLDDIASCKMTDWATEKMFSIIDIRQGKNTIYTTSKSSKQIIALYGEDIVSRMLSHKEYMFKLDGQDQRQA